VIDHTTKVAEIKKMILRVFCSTFQNINQDNNLPVSVGRRWYGIWCTPDPCSPSCCL